ncbi:hypothetical protein [Paenibacillus hamazuiensis]|uniref:hypothetical protein n=1 Tax=Paenibacillus hamazuiensis TaxID=2936508 RepID=UPI00200BA9CC|nr:hypothetical protein [Paenibacillus hamazuiensis]
MAIRARAQLSSAQKALIKKVLMKKVRKVVKKKKRALQTLGNLHIIVTNNNGVPRETTNWTATVTRPGVTMTANFDDFGVARFNIATLTTVSYTLRVRNANGDLVATRLIPEDVEAYVVRI